MKKVRAGFDDAPRPEADEENERAHEKNRRIKSEQERFLRKQLSRLRVSDEDEDEREGASRRGGKD